MRLDTPISSALGAQTASLEKQDINILERITRLSGIPDVTLKNRLSVIFVYPGMGVGNVYPDLAGCTTEVCAFIEESGVFEKHGIQVIGLSTEFSEPPPGCLAIPFSTGVLPQKGVESPIEFVEKEGKKYAVRASFIIGPDASGLKITHIEDVVGHVKLCFQLALDKRLARYRDAAMDYLTKSSNSIHPRMLLRGLLPNGADSVAIPRVDMTLQLVAKLADQAIITEEARYISCINRLLVDNRQEELFPTVLAICDDEEPAWYLMEAVDPTKFDEIVFSDEARTILSASGKGMINGAVDKLIGLYTLTRRMETPAVAYYHYLERFLHLPDRRDFRNTFDLLVRGDLENNLAKRFVLDEKNDIGSYQEHIEFLKFSVDRLVQPFGTYLHGDAHLPNMLLASDKSDMRFIDPRVVWDGNDVGQPGFGDPLYDLGTLLHSIHVMSGILYAVETETTSNLLDITDCGAHVSVRTGALQVANNPFIEDFLAYVEEHLPSELLGSHWRSRIHVNAANALIGWLKYLRAIQTAHAWWAVYAAALYHLEEGRRNMEGNGRRV